MSKNKYKGGSSDKPQIQKAYWRNIPAYLRDPNKAQDQGNAVIFVDPTTGAPVATRDFGNYYIPEYSEQVSEHSYAPQAPEMKHGSDNIVDAQQGAAYSPEFIKHFYGTSDFSALLGDSRVQGMKTAWERNPQAMQLWTDAGNEVGTAAMAFLPVGELFNAGKTITQPFISRFFSKVPTISRSGAEMLSKVYTPSTRMLMQTPTGQIIEQSIPSTITLSPTAQATAITTGLLGAGALANLGNTGHIARTTEVGTEVNDTTGVDSDSTGITQTDSVGIEGNQPEIQPDDEENNSSNEPPEDKKPNPVRRVLNRLNGKSNPTKPTPKKDTHYLRNTLIALGTSPIWEPPVEAGVNHLIPLAKKWRSLWVENNQVNPSNTPTYSKTPQEMVDSAFNAQRKQYLQNTEDYGGTD